MGHMGLEIVGFDEKRIVEPVKHNDGTVLDLIPGPVVRSLRVANAEGEAMDIVVSEDDWKRVVAPLFGGCGRWPIE